MNIGIRCLLYALVLCNAISFHEIRAQPIKWNHHYSIGLEDSDDVDDLYGDIDDIFVQSLNDIYIGDDLPMHIRHVDSTGTVIGIVAGRGIGPDKLRSMSTFTIDREGRTIVVDYRSRRIKTFLADGTFQMSTEYQDLGFPRRMQQINSDGDFIFLSGRSGRPVNESRYLFTHTDAQYNVIYKFGNTGEMQIDTTDFVANYMDFNPGYFDSDGEHLVYSPPVYRGKLYIFNRQGTSWSLPQIAVRSIEGESIVTYEPNDRPPESILIKSNVQDDYAAKILVRSIGIHLTDNSLISHFYIMESESDNDNKYVIVMDQFTLSGDFHATRQIPYNGLARMSSVQSSIEVADYRSGVYYLIDTTRYPQVHAVTIPGNQE